MPVNTFRMWSIGLFTVLIISAVNQIFSMRCEHEGSNIMFNSDIRHQIPLSIFPPSSLS